MKRSAFVLNYHGSVSLDKPLPIAGLKTLGAEAYYWGYGLSLLWRPPVDLGERWNYGMSTTISVVSMEVAVHVVSWWWGPGPLRAIDLMVLLPP